MARRKLNEATLKDFGGGWNTSDSDLNLSSRYQPISDNIIRGSDGSFSVRQGYRLFADGQDGVTTEYIAQAVTFNWTITNPKLIITWTGHPFVDGDHITISDISGADPQNGVAHSEITLTHGILYIDANNFAIPLNTIDAAATVANALTITAVHDTDIIGGNIIHKTYYNRLMLLFSDIGEIYTMSNAGVIAILWNYKIADTLTAGLLPSRNCDHWSTSTNRTTLIACNGYDKDKPIQIFSDFTISFLYDKSTLSNAFVPKADWVKSMHSYVIFARTEYGDTFAEISAIGTDGTFTREASPADSVEVDVGLATETVEPKILGLTQLRNKLYVSFYDRGMLGVLGSYNGAVHVPNFNDTLAEHGTLSHRTMVSLGNDIFMADYAGVPSVNVSQQSADYVPVRVSELIGSSIRAHLNVLDEDELRSSAFAVFNKNERAYMLFLHNTTEPTHTLEDNPLYFTTELMELNQVYMYIKDHGLFERTNITISGATGIDTQLTAGDINGVRKVVSIVDKDGIIIQLADKPATTLPINGGGTSMIVVPVKDETIIYHFEYNKELRIRRWTRFRDLHFGCAAVSQRGKLFVTLGKRIYLMGSASEPIYADMVDDYHYNTERISVAVAIDDRVLSSVDGNVYVCIKAHTASGTPIAMHLDEENWELFTGLSIIWALDTPWSSISKPELVKNIKYIHHDTEGTAQFDFSIFTEQVYRDKQTNALIPNRTMSFTCGDTGGFGINGPIDFGSGRRTKEAVVWPMEARGKLIRLRWSGETKLPARFVSTTLLYRLGNIRK